MKKIILGLLAAALLSLGLVGGVADSAKADPYTGTVATKVRVGNVTSPIRRNTAPRVDVRVLPTSGNTSPKGLVRMVCGKGSTVKSGLTVRYSGKLRLTGPKLTKKGTWGCTVRYNGLSSIHKASKSVRFTVRVR